MTPILFGTDGWRGRIGEDYTFDNVRRCAQGFANYLRDITKPAALARGVVIGHDKRFSGREFALAAAEVITGNGIPVTLLRGTDPHPGDFVSCRPPQRAWGDQHHGQPQPAGRRRLQGA